MSFFAKLKKKNKPPDTPSEHRDQPSRSEIEETPSPTVEAPTSPVRHPVQTQSIFSGLHLSSKVALGEAPDSPYTKRNSPGKFARS